MGMFIGLSGGFESLGWIIAYVSIVFGGAIVLDWLVGDPKRWHPVRGLGMLIAFLDEHWNRGRYRRGKGIVLVLVVSSVVVVPAIALLILLYQLHWLIGIAAEIVMLWISLAIYGLQGHAEAVVRPLLTGDIQAARRALQMIVGRDTDTLNEGEIARAAVETVAENTVDSITSPIFWAMIGGAPLALLYRAINTLDAMVGYRTERYDQFGWASARMDDWLNWLPARVTVGTMVIGAIVLALRSRYKRQTRLFWYETSIASLAYLTFSKTIRRMWHVVRRDAPQHPSPNSGWPEAAIAGLLGVQLGGRNTYNGVVSNRARMGDARRPLHALDIRRSIVLMHSTWVVFVFVSCIVGCLLIGCVQSTVMSLYS